MFQQAAADNHPPQDEFGGWFEALITDNANCVATIAELEARVPGLSLGKKYQIR